MLEVSFAHFAESVRGMLTKSAEDKGYSGAKDPDVGGDLLAFVNKHFEGHSLGEVVYKAVRFRAKKDPKDLEKIAAWAFLEWAGCPGTWPNRGWVPSPTGSIPKIADTVKAKAIEAYARRGNVSMADNVRLAALVAEEAGEALKSALDMTRIGVTKTGEVEAHLISELVQTAVMAVIATQVIMERRIAVTQVANGGPEKS